ncbi:hypothetical protein GOZ80_07850 [Agrobacterium vitis]|uniref:Uncharacterized protein n=1 Tax=Agrobacterium vitis TaxID=373 RepID=A0ABD6GCC9_AGRVI|nr:hypothetical protein [Agrobacterium vitis]MUO80578.1 hypothetical protein [Agrobacterium vitis]MUO93803.1 hypothetical protein [Agrobacterium vitis]MUP03946.1 hypothetical protein [Agrobacterium vitis]MVA91939.1 hypothetical protein [Agrobacterium vitis]MVB01492.1 hypothetical protein [Agrobacterium vitis]
MSEQSKGTLKQLERLLPEGLLADQIGIGRAEVEAEQDRAELGLSGNERLSDAGQIIPRDRDGDAGNASGAQTT